LEKSDLRDNQ